MKILRIMIILFVFVLVVGTASAYAPKTPWDVPDVGSAAAPAFADLDGDGDYDLLIGEDGAVSFAYENTGDAINPIWTAKTAWNTPDVPDVGYTAPAFADLDGDGDYDLLIGEVYGRTRGYENTGDASNPIWTAKTAWNAFYDYLAAPALADLDGDGDYDLLIGGLFGGSKHYENTGTASNPIWNSKWAWKSPDVRSMAAPAFADLDGDGDYDLLIGESNGVSFAYENTGTANNPIWTAKTAWNAPDVGSLASPAFADLDGDGDYDLLIGESGGVSKAYENTGTVSYPIWTAKTTSNDEPMANDDSGTTDENTSVIINAVSNDIDPDGDSVSVDSVDTTGTVGLVTNHGDGNITYDPNGQFEYLQVGESATDSFNYTISDGNGGTDEATVTITINGVNDAPVANDDSGITDEDTSVKINVVSNDSDPEDDTLSVDSVDTTGTVGQVTDNGDGNITYDPNGQFEYLQVGESATDSFNYTISDGNGGTDEATVTITINGVNDTPVANDDSYITAENTVLTVSAHGVLGNDTDVEDDTLTAGLEDSPAHGSVALNADGSFTYTPDADYYGFDTFTYKANDSQADSNVATVTISVIPHSVVTSSSLCMFDCDTELDGNQFKLIFTPNQDPINTFKLSASNPGQFSYNLYYPEGTEIEVAIPYLFVTQGAVPIHFYSDVQMSGSDGLFCFTPGELIGSDAQIVTMDDSGGIATLTITIPEGASFATIHLDYDLKNTAPYTNGGVDLKDAIGDSTVTGNISHNTVYQFSADGDTAEIRNLNIFKKTPGIGGLITEDGSPVDEGEVVIDSTVLSGPVTVLSDEDGWYMWNYKHKDKATEFTISYDTLSETVVLKANKLAIVNFES